MPCRGCFALTVAAGILLSGHAAFGAEEPSRIYLHKGWQIQSSCEVKASGAKVSAAGFNAQGWHHTDVPATVVGALVAASLSSAAEADGGGGVAAGAAAGAAA